jgi:hypothetical protein
MNVLYWFVENETLVNYSFMIFLSAWQLELESILSSFASFGW